MCIRDSVGFIVAAALYAQAPPANQPRPLAPEPWRRTGVRPCVRPGSGFAQCSPPAGVMAVRAGRLFDSQAGRMLTSQVVVVNGERIVEVGPEAQVKIPAGARVVDLSRATVLPGLIDAQPSVGDRGPIGGRRARGRTRTRRQGCRSYQAVSGWGLFVQPHGRSAV